MNPASPPASTSRHDPFVVAVVCGLLSAIFYTATNVFLRQVAETRDPAWVGCVKSLPVVLVATIVLARRRLRGEHVLPTWRVLGLLVGTGLIVQIVGNVLNQWALGQVGMTVTVPLTLGAIIVSGVVMGRVFLGEPISPRAVVSLAVLVLSILVLSVGTERAEVGTTSLGATPTQSSVALGVLAACISGLAYATSHVTIRRVSGGNTPMAAALGVIAFTGTVTLGAITLGVVGWEEIRATTRADLFSMVMAGMCNAAAFFSLGKSLQVLSMAYVNAFNASQTAMSAMAGVLVFGEAFTPTLAVGVLLTIAGLLVMRTSNPRHEEVGMPVEPLDE
ncbi:MAG: DMT family transporter [Pirellulales bacterium]|nr:DMT family transporter [Pirellulales bacterium]